MTQILSTFESLPTSYDKGFSHEVGIMNIIKNIHNKGIHSVRNELNCELGGYDLFTPQIENVGFISNNVYKSENQGKADLHIQQLMLNSKNQPYLQQIALSLKAKTIQVNDKPYNSIYGHVQASPLDMLCNKYQWFPLTGHFYSLLHAWLEKNKPLKSFSTLELQLMTEMLNTLLNKITTEAFFGINSASANYLGISTTKITQINTTQFNYELVDSSLFSKFNVLQKLNNSLAINTLQINFDNDGSFHTPFISFHRKGGSNPHYLQIRANFIKLLQYL